MNILNPMLLAKLRAIQAIFFEQWRQVPLYRFPTFNQPQEPAIENPFANYNDLEQTLLNLIKTTDEEDSSEGSGGGTAKGLRIEKGMPPRTQSK